VKQQHTSTATSIPTTKSTHRSRNSQRLFERTVTRPKLRKIALRYQQSSRNYQKGINDITFIIFTTYGRISHLTDMIHLLTAIGLTPGGSSPVHIWLTPGGSSPVHIWLTPGGSSPVHIWLTPGGSSPVHIWLTPGGSSPVHMWLTPGGSSTVHIYTQTVHRTTQLRRIHRTGQQ
jgi:hypothetical protein